MVVLRPLLCLIIIKCLLFPHHSPTNFEIQKYYKNEPRFNAVISRDNLQKIKDGAYIITLDEYSDIGSHWVALHVNNNNVTYFHSFGVDNIPNEIKAFIKNKNIKKKNIFRVKAYDSVMCGYFCIEFTDFMFNGKILTEYTNIFHQIILRNKMT